MRLLRRDPSIISFFSCSEKANLLATNTRPKWITTLLCKNAKSKLHPNLSLFPFLAISNRSQQQFSLMGRSARRRCTEAAMSEGKVRLGNVRPVTGGRRAELRPELRPSCEAIRLRHPPPEPGHGSAWAWARGSQGVRPDNVLFLGHFLWKSVAFYVDSAWLKVLIKLKASVLIWDRITDWGPPVTQLTSHLKAEPGNLLEYINIFYHFTIHDKFRQQNLFQHWKSKTIWVDFYAFPFNKILTNICIYFVLKKGSQMRRWCLLWSFVNNLSSTFLIQDNLLFLAMLQWVLKRAVSQIGLIFHLSWENLKRAFSQIGLIFHSFCTFPFRA